MNSKLIIILGLSFVLCFGLAGQTLAQSRIPGVKSQDYLIYSIVAYWSSENASAPVPSSLVDLNKTSQYQVTIGGTSGVNITSTHSWSLENGTQINYLVTIDVESGEAYYHSFNQPPFEGIVGADINSGSLLHPAGNDSITINQTITRNYASGPRDTNVVELTGQIENETLDSVTNTTVFTTIGTEKVEFYLDKATGVLVEQNTTVESFEPQESASIVWTLRDTNLWDVAQPLDLLLIVIIVVAVAVAIIAPIVYLRLPRKGKQKKR
jgi:hypothetical protein